MAAFDLREHDISVSEIHRNQAYDDAAIRPAELFRHNFNTYEQGVSDEVRTAGPATAAEQAVA